ncbi:type II toxin-antitoxin system VapC family toxin [Metallibacterium sp.]|uniref:type II toxin-antitoxin system VapC family toxin n=1 Tax=Metallibacterium sp. TaxID=2940281 RepID=UPI0026031F55|nr:type II toxin-antitoxin system VapC family toxin [Metallibacterium sp.]
MTLLLDTHALLWWLTDDARLSVPARQAIGDEQNTIYVSAASIWEISTKQRIGKMPHLTQDFVLRLPDVLAEERFTELAVSARHALRAGLHSAAHRDPFDRMLAAQAEIELAALVSSDESMVEFGIPLLW